MRPLKVEWIYSLKIAVTFSVMLKLIKHILKPTLFFGQLYQLKENKCSIFHLLNIQKNRKVFIAKAFDGFKKKFSPSIFKI